MKAIRLNDHDSVSDTKLNMVYVGKVVSETGVSLNKSIVGKLKASTKLEKGTMVAVRVTKISLPYGVELDLLGKDFELDKPTHTFFVESDLLKKLEPKLRKAANLIRNAIKNSQPIFLKHHADCDGYIGGIALEKAILSLVTKRHRGAPWHYFRRTPCRAPYYDYPDVIKDITTSYSSIQAGKPPLILILDNGSSDQDLLAIKKAKLYNATVVVVDHHKPAKQNGSAVVEEHVDVFVNPYNVGGDNSLTAGMLGVELSRMITRNHGVEHLPAISGIADRSDCKEFELYVELAKKSGFSRELLEKIAKCVDFEAFYLGYMDSKIVADLLFDETNQQKRKLGLIFEDILKREQAIVEVAEKRAHKLKLDRLELVEIEITDITQRGEYPSQGKATGIVFSHFKSKGELPLVVLGIGIGSITMRTNKKDLDLNQLIKDIKNELPHALVEGGGHEQAATIHFTAGAKQDVIDLIKKRLKN